MPIHITYDLAPFSLYSNLIRDPNCLDMGFLVYQLHKIINITILSNLLLTLELQSLGL